MSTSRNKRKRPEIDIPIPTPVSRRRSARDARSGTEPTEPNRKNEGNDDDGAEASKLLATGDKSIQAATSSAEPRTANVATAAQTAATTAEATNDIIGGNYNNKNALGGDQNMISSVDAADQEAGSSTAKNVQSTGPATAGEIPGAVKQQLNNSEKPRNSRQSRIASMISHRKLLLDRTRQGKAAARKRIVDLTSSELTQSAQNALATESPDGNVENFAPLTERAKDESERAEFERITQAAIQAAKKHRAENSDGLVQEKRTSLSLRRGSSVGKKMTAALSALVPGNTGSSSTAAATALDGPKEPLHLSSATGRTEELPKAVPSSQTVPPARMEQSTFAPVGRPKIPLAATVNTGKRMKSATLPTQSTLGATQAAARAASASFAEVGHKNFRAMPPKSTKSSANAAAAAAASRTSSSLGGQNTAAMPLHTGLGGGGPTLPPNKLSHLPVVCPQARALRERRNSLRSKLDRILQERQKRIESETKATASSLAAQRPSMRRTASTTTTGNTNIIQERGSACHLPRRRRTHWDDLLEEMRWMATDYIEERKWKESAARTVSSAVMAQRFNASLPVAAKGVAENAATLENGTVGDVWKTSESHAATTEKKDSRSRAYDLPTLEDVTAGRKAAKIISSMVYELNNCILRVGPLPRTDRLQSKALERHLATRSNLAKPDADASTAAGNVPATIPEGGIEDGDNTEMEISPEASVEGSEEETKSQKENSFIRITNTVDGILKQSASGRTSARKPSKRKVDSGVRGEGDDLALTSSQIEAIDFLEKRWDANDKPGACITGTRSSGKTIAICSLLWRHRLDGAQLVVCSPLRVFKWMHELKRFHGLRVRAFGFSGGIGKTALNSNHSDAFEPSDVIICEYGALNRMKQHHFAQLSSMVIDCRYPRGFLGSRWPSVSDEWKNDYEDDTNHVASGIPHELTLSSWWESLVTLMAKFSINRVMIENPGRRLFADCYNEGSAKKQIELLALRAAYVLGPPIFVAPKSSIKKRILTWARKRSKGTDGDKTSEIERVQSLFLEMLDPLRCQVMGNGLLEDILPSLGEKLVSEVRMCELTSVERFDYNKCCFALRGALSASIAETLDHRGDHGVLDGVADALLRLRKLCVHTQILSLFENASLRTRLRINVSMRDTSTFPLGDRMLFRKVDDSSSQIDVEVASLLLERSPKFRELLSILRNECDYRIENEYNLGLFLRAKTAQRGRPSQDKSPPCPKKVVILAALPEVQILVSVLLNSIGITHELLLRPSRFSNPSRRDITIDFPVEQMNATILSWAECQQALSRFNTPMAREDASNSMVSNMVITSAVTIAGDHGGLGVDMADVVISLDEDWSGRGELIMRSLLAGLIRRNARSKDKGCKIMRLVCASTCEESFLDGLEMSIEENRRPSDDSAWPWSLDTCGRFVAVDARCPADVAWYQRKLCEGMFAFPAFNIFKCRGKNLSEVLSTSELPPLLQFSVHLCFLPHGNQQALKGGKQSRADELKLLVSLMEREDQACTRFRDSCLMAISQVSLRCDALTRHDLGAISTRMFLRQFGKSVVPIHALSGSQRASTVASTDVIFASPGGNVASQLEGNSALLAPWCRGELSLNPIDFASSLLLYRTDIPGNDAGRRAKEQVAEQSRHLPDTQRARWQASLKIPPTRSNKFACVYDSLVDSNIHDGHQGSEGLVYFPPLFPRLLHCTIQARHDIEAVRDTRRTPSVYTPASDQGDDKKRPAEDPAIPSAKRSKTENTTFMEMDESPTAAQATAISSAVGENAARTPATEYRVITEDEASHSDAATVLLDLDEDFGLAGIGAIPLPKDSAIASSGTSIEVSRPAYDAEQLLFESDLLSDITACDLEELEAFRHGSTRGLFMNSMILFVARKRPRTPSSSLPTVLYRNTQGVPGTDPQWVIPPSLPLRASGNGAFHDMNGAASSAKKAKKSALLPSAEFAQPPHTVAHPPTNMPISKATEVFRNRLFSFMTSRQRNMGVTLFETPAYHIAAIRLRNRITDRMPHQCWTSSSALKVGPGLPLLLAKQATTYSGFSISEPTVWTSVVKRLKNQQSKTGDDAVTIASTQRSAFRRSLVAPSRVDFGPFGCGFLASLSGMTGISPPRSRIGVSLPMGVKVPQASREQLHHPWREDDDRKLRKCAVRFNMNWIFAARAVSGFEDIAISSTRDRIINDPNGPPPRSARQCRDRWQVLARHDPTLAKEVRKSERDLRASFLTRPPPSLGENILAHRLEVETISDGIPIIFTRAAQPPKMGGESVRFLGAASILSGSTGAETASHEKGDEESVMEIDSVAASKAEASPNAVAVPKLEASPESAPVKAADKGSKLASEGVEAPKLETSPSVVASVKTAIGDSEVAVDTVDTPKIESSSNGVIQVNGDDTSRVEAARVDASKVVHSRNVGAPSRWSFGALAAAKAKTQVIPRTIPGVGAGSPPSFVASHPSHLQSVQTSVAASWSNGRTEMWPLQFLDVVEKHRAAQAAAAAVAVAPTAAPTPIATSAPPAARAAAAPRPHSSASNTTASTGRTYKASGSRSSSTSKPKTPSQRASFPQVPTPVALPAGSHHPTSRAVVMTPSTRAHPPPPGQPHYPAPTPVTHAQPTPVPTTTKLTPSPKKSGSRSTKKSPPSQPKPPPPS